MTSSIQQLKMERTYTTAGIDPFEEIVWKKRDVKITNWRDGTVNFEQKGVEFPDFWEDNAVQIVTSKYFRGGMGTPEREWSLEQLIKRVVSKYVATGLEEGYFDAEGAQIFEDEISYMLLHQIFSFNSPVWFNVGTKGKQQISACFLLGVEDSMEAILDWYKEEGLIFKGGSGAGINLSKLRGSKEPLSIGGTASGPISFMRGADSSAGAIKSGGASRRAAKLVCLDIDHPDIEEFIDLKMNEERKIRALRDAGFDMDLDGKDTPSVQYQNANNSVQVTDEFMTKVDDFHSGNIDEYWPLKSRIDGKTVQEVPVSKLFRQMAESAWACADPGIQYSDTINSWHTNPHTGPITTSNPCQPAWATVMTPGGVKTIRDLRVGDKIYSGHEWTTVTNKWSTGIKEVHTYATAGGVFVGTKNHRVMSRGRKVEVQYADCIDDALGFSLPIVSINNEGFEEVFDITVEAEEHTYWTGGLIVSNCSEYLSIDNSSCNLASINLLKFLRDDNTFDGRKFIRAVEMIITAMDISICFADFPTKKITDNTRAFRQLGIGYANLGALLMSAGLPYDSDEGRDLAGSITSLMSATAWRRSAELAEALAPYDGYALNKIAHDAVVARHAAASKTNYEWGDDIWDHAGTIWVDAVVEGGESGYRNAQVSLLPPTGTCGLAMGVDTTGIEPALGLVTYKKLVGGGSMKFVNGTITRALTSLKHSPQDIKAITDYITEHGHVVGSPLRSEYSDVFDCALGERAISPMGHIKMMAAVQPYLSGSISKTINLPDSATVEDIEDLYLEGWKLGLKSLAVYRDNCKVGQPLSIAKTPASEAPQVAVQPRKRLGKRRPSTTYSFDVAGAKGYLIASTFDDGKLAEIFLRLSKQGSTLAGIMDAFAISISLGLQTGVPLETYVAKYTSMRFEPAGRTDDPELRMATSIVDYVFRRLALDFLHYEEREEFGIFSSAERAQQVSEVPTSTPVLSEAAPATVSSNGNGHKATAPLCLNCGGFMQRAGSCYLCSSCGTSSGCS
jgi:ribonucleotide reductase alpha subunit